MKTKLVNLSVALLVSQLMMAQFHIGVKAGAAAFATTGRAGERDGAASLGSSNDRAGGGLEDGESERTSNFASGSRVDQSTLIWFANAVTTKAPHHR